MKVSFFEVQDWEKPFIAVGLSGIEVRMFKEPLDEKHAADAQDSTIISVFIYSQLNRELIEKLNQTRLIATRSTGYDHIDAAAAKQKGIAVCNVPTYGEITVAEHTIALLLSLSRQIHESYERTRRGDFNCQTIQGFELNGKVLGVLGTGKIGLNVIEIARGFKMQVLAYDKYPKMAVAKQLGFEYVSWEELLARSDVISLHLPLNNETFHFLNAQSISMMKPGAVVINTARGALIDSQALTTALLDGRLSGAGLDVLEEEALIREEAQLLLDNVPREQLATMLRTHILLRLKNVIITPHCAFNSKESLQRLINGTVDNINAFISGKPQHVVNQ